MGSKTPASILQEYAVSIKQTIHWSLTSQVDAGTHQPMFTYMVQIGGLYAAEGSGKSKQEAKHTAAQNLLDYLQVLDIQEVRDQLGNASQAHSSLGYNAIGELSEYCRKKRHPAPEMVATKDEGPPHMKTFTFKCLVSNICTIAEARTKKDAKQKAAHEMLAKLKAQDGEEINPVACIKNPISSPGRSLISNTKHDLKKELVNNYFNVKGTIEPNGNRYVDYDSAFSQTQKLSDTLKQIADGDVAVTRENALSLLKEISKELGTEFSESKVDCYKGKNINSLNQNTLTLISLKGATVATGIGSNADAAAVNLIHTLTLLSD